LRQEELEAAGMEVTPASWDSALAVRETPRTSSMKSNRTIRPPENPTFRLGPNCVGKPAKAVGFAPSGGLIRLERSWHVIDLPASDLEADPVQLRPSGRDQPEVVPARLDLPRESLVGSP